MYKMLISAAVIIVIILLLSSCGGGGISGPSFPQQVSQRVIYFGYYLSGGQQLEETQGHTNLLFMPTELEMTQSDQPIVLNITDQIYRIGNDSKFHLREDADQRLHEYYAHLESINMLQRVVAVYPIDEPEINVAVYSEIVSANHIISNTVGFGVRPAIAVFYSAKGFYPGFDSYDWVGFDHYSNGDSVYSNGEYDKFVSMLSPEQKVMLIPGGAFGESPSAAIAKAQQDERVVAVVPFIWFDNWAAGKTGIRSMPDRQSYCEAGKQITGKTGGC